MDAISGIYGHCGKLYDVGDQENL